MAALHETLGTDHSITVDGMALVEAAVKVAEMGISKRDGAALQTIALDVATDIDVHTSSLSGGAPPPGW